MLTKIFFYPCIIQVIVIRKCLSSKLTTFRLARYRVSKMLILTKIAFSEDIIWSRQSSVKYQKIILQLGTIYFKSNFHGIFPHFVGIRPQKFNFVKKFRYFLYLLAFFAGHPEPSKSCSNQYLSNFGLFAWRTSRNVKIQEFLLLQLPCEDP